MSRSGHILKFASPELRDCEEIVCEAVKVRYILNGILRRLLAE